MTRRPLAMTMWAMALGVCAASVSLPVEAAQTVAPRADERVRCDSNDGRWNHCRVSFDGDARLLRQLSRDACIRNHSWGRDAQGVWVARGCRGEFGPAVADDAAENASDITAKRVRCDSRSGGYQHCAVETAGGVMLLRTLSRAPCELGESWGFDTEGVWVSRGCRAEFELKKVQSRGASGPGFLQRLFGRERKPEAMGGGRPLRCESIDGAFAECAIGAAKRVELVRQMSHAACERGTSWDWGEGKLWVKQGCRAEFLIW